MTGRGRLRALLGEMVEAGAVTAVAGVHGQATSIASQAAAGVTRRKDSGRVTTSSLFDLASLTKPVTATLALVLDADGTLPLRRSIGSALSEGEVPVHPALARKSLGSLLRHGAGFQAWAPLFQVCRDPQEVLGTLATDSNWLGAEPSTYSDLGYIAWALVAERMTGRPLFDLVRSRVARPLGLRLAQAPGDVRSVVECRLGNDRERDLARGLGVEIAARRPPVIGAIQDGNARFLRGASGHAGLFGSARALWRLAVEWIEPGRLLARGQVESALAGRGGYALGWRRRPPETARRSGLWYGHIGFTGGGVWFCPRTREIRVLLAHRSSVSVRLASWRKRFLEIDARSSRGAPGNL